MRSTRSHWDKLPPDVSQSVFGLLWPPPECALLPRSSPSVAVVPASGASNRIRMGSGLQRPSPRVNFLQDVALARLVCRNWAKQVAGAAPWLFPRPWEAPPAGWQQKFSGLRWLLLEGRSLSTNAIGDGGDEDRAAAAELQMLPSTLESLSLLGCHWFGNHSAAAIAQAAAGLSCLDLPRCRPVTASCLHALASSSGSSPLPSLAGSLKCLDLTDCWGLTDEGMAALAAFTGLTSLNLSCNARQVTNAGLAELASLRFLRCLELADCRMVTDSGLITVLCRLESSLTHLDLRRCAGVTDDGLDALRYLTNLIHLDLTSCCEISGNGLMALEPLTALAFLSLEGCTNIGDGIQNLPPLPALTHLDIGSIDASSGRGLARALSPLTALHHLSLRGCTALRESDLKEAIPHLTSLMSLWLTECTHIKDEGVASLSPLMSLTYLDLSNTQVGDRALASLSTTHTALTHLNILDCPAPETPAGMSSLSQLPSLVSLSARDIRGDLDSKDLGLCALTSLELIDEYGTMDDSAVLQVSSLAGLQALCLSVGFPAEISIQGLEPLSKLKSLASLSLDIVNLCDFHLQQLGGLVGLTRLEVGYLTEEGVGLEALWPLGQRLEALKLEASERFCRADALRHLTALTDLSLRDCSGITDEGLGRGLAPLGRLTRLDISWCRRLTTEGLLATLMPLRRLSRLDTDGLRSASSTVRVMLGIPER